MPSRGRTSHPGTRAAHTRRTKRGATPVRAAPIRRPSAAQKRAKVARQVRQGKRPLLWGAAAFAGLGAFEAILMGRWGTAFVLFGAAGALGLTHVAWSAHKRRQASRPSRQTTMAAQSWEEAYAKHKAKRAAMTDDEKIKEAGDWSTRMARKERAFKEGVRRKAERVWFGQAKAEELAAERKDELRHPPRRTRWRQPRPENGRVTASQQRRMALEKARAAHQYEQPPTAAAPPSPRPKSDYTRRELWESEKQNAENERNRQAYLDREADRKAGAR